MVFLVHVLDTDDTRSKTKSQTISQTALNSKKDFSQTTKRHKNMATCYFCSSPNPGTLRTCVASSPWPRLMRYCRQSCSQFTETSTRAEKSICS